MAVSKSTTKPVEVEGAAPAAAVWHPTVYRPTMEDAKLKVLLYGEPGVGKTTLAASASRCEALSPVLIISVEGGEMSISESTTWVDASNVAVTKFTTFGELERLFNYLAFSAHPYKTVVVDSISELQNEAVSVWTQQLNPAGDDAVPNLERDKQMSLKIYGRATDMMREKLRRFRDLPLHIIFTAHTREGNEGTVKTGKIGPSLMPQLGASVVGFVDIMAYMFTKGDLDEDGNQPRFILCSPLPNFAAKDRSPGGKLGKMITDPTMGRIWELLTAKEKPE